MNENISLILSYTTASLPTQNRYCGCSTVLKKFFRLTDNIISQLGDGLQVDFTFQPFMLGDWNYDGVINHQLNYSCLNEHHWLAISVNQVLAVDLQSKFISRTNTNTLFYATNVAGVK